MSCTSDRSGQVKGYLSQGRFCIRSRQWQPAADLLQQACKACTQHKGSKELMYSIQEATALLPDDWCSQYWSACITKAQEPNPLSSRDGRLLRPVPKTWKLPHSELTRKLQEAMQKLHEVQAGLLCAAWGSTGQPDKASLALMRGYAYARAGKPEQALRDAQTVLSYAPKQAGSRGICKWPCAHALHSAAHEGLQDNVPAALAMQIAHEMDLTSEHHRADLERLMRRIPFAVADILEAGGSAGLQQWLEDEEERKKPEFLKQRPKYFYYYEWMKERITAAHPALPEPVMDKLLTMPAGDLDLILQHPKATTWKVDELMGLLEDKGPAFLECYPVKGLSWEQVKELNGPNLVGLGMGSGPAPGEGLIEMGLDRHEQLKLQAQQQGLLEGGMGTQPGCHARNTHHDCQNLDTDDSNIGHQRNDVPEDDDDDEDLEAIE